MGNRRLRGDGEWHLIRGPYREGIAYKLERNKHDKDEPDGLVWGNIEVATITDTSGLIDIPDPDGDVLVTQVYIELNELPGKGMPGTDILGEALNFLAEWGGEESFAKSRTEAWNRIE